MRATSREREGDASPVTEADTRAERVILEGLGECAPGIAVVAEESFAAGNVPEIGGEPFFLVDPLDGTREFISRNGEFTVNVALIEHGIPTVGVVHLPALDETFWTAGDGAAWRHPPLPAAPPKVGGGERIACRRPGGDGLVVIASRSHPRSRDRRLAPAIRGRRGRERGLVVEVLPDRRRRGGPLFRASAVRWNGTSRAGHAVVNAAGGSVETIDGRRLVYGKPGFDNPHFVVRGLPREQRMISPDRGPRPPFALNGAE